MSGVPSYIHSDNGPEFIAMGCKTGSWQVEQRPHTSNQAAHGRTVTVKASIRDSEMSSWIGKFSKAQKKLGFPRNMEETPQHQTPTLRSEIQATGSGSHRSDEPKAYHAITNKFDYTNGADQ